MNQSSRSGNLASVVTRALVLPAFLSPQLAADHGASRSPRPPVRASTVARASTPPATCLPWITEGEQAGVEYGSAVASAGDVNGDGYADVIVGALKFSNGESLEGRAFVYHGGPDGLSSVAAWTAESNQAGALFGSSVASAGDVNGDGYDDVIVGAPGWGSPSGDGAAFLYHGSEDGLAASPAWSVLSSWSGARYGSAVASAGDVNGDGYSDVLVGAVSYSQSQFLEGRVFLYHGSAAGLEATEAWSLESDETFAQLGVAISSAGDVNGDGYADILVGALGANGFAGEAYVFHGSPSGVSTTADWTGNPNALGQNFGKSAACAGDVDGDGIVDVIVGSSEDAQVFRGGPAGLEPSPSWTLQSSQVDQGFVAAVSGAGDIDGDGFSDVLVGEPAYLSGELSEGRVLTFHGSAQGPSLVPTWQVEGNQRFANLGRAVAGAGDVNGDGYADVLVAAPGLANGFLGEGQASVHHGSPTGIATIPSSVTWRNAGTNTDSYVATSPAMGRTWTATVAAGTTGHTHAAVRIAAVSDRTVTRPDGQVLLAAGPRLGTLPLQPGPTATWTLPIPNALALCGLALQTQAVHLMGAPGVALTNAQDLVLGF